MRRRTVAKLGMALVLVSCAPELDSPESRVRALLVQAERAAEARDAEALGELVGEDYRDDRGNNRRTVLGLLTYYFLRNRTVHLLTRIRSLEAPEPERVEATLLVAMAGRPIPGVEGLARIRADLYRFDFVFALDPDDDWRVVRAEWHPAGLDDFL